VTKYERAFSSRLACGVRTVRLEGVALLELADRDAPVDLIGRDVEKLLYPKLSARLKEREDPVDVREHEAARIVDRSVDVRLGRKIDDGVHVSHQVLNDRLVSDIPLKEHEPGVVREIRQVVHIAGIRERIEHDYAILGILAQHVATEIASDKTGPAGNQNRLHNPIHLIDSIAENLLHLDVPIVWDLIGVVRQSVLVRLGSDIRFRRHIHQ